MDIIDKELNSKYSEIKDDMMAVFKTYFDISGWDIPELDEEEVTKKLLVKMQEALDEVKQEVLKEYNK